jgi:hypothetical protein
MVWVKSRTLEFDEEGSTRRITTRIREDGYLFYQGQSDYHHTFPFKDQQYRLEQQFVRFSQEMPDTGQWTVADFDEDFEERLVSMKAKEVFPGQEVVV